MPNLFWSAAFALEMKTRTETVSPRTWSRALSVVTAVSVTAELVLSRSYIFKLGIIRQKANLWNKITLVKKASIELRISSSECQNRINVRNMKLSLLFEELVMKMSLVDTGVFSNSHPCKFTGNFRPCEKYFVPRNIVLKFVMFY